jgi:hypothetical protein
VYRVDGECRDAQVSAEERLAYHQKKSAPVMAKLKIWIETQLSEKRVEPNSELGKAYKYVLKRWDRLTLFLRKPGVPIDNNLCERILKMAIRHRNNSLFYRSQRGGNPFEYLTAILQNEKAVAQHPADWLPWSYRTTLARRSAGA